MNRVVLSGRLAGPPKLAYTATGTPVAELRLLVPRLNGNGSPDDVLEEIDGLMLQHGLQGFQGRRIHVPRADHLKPNRDFLAERYVLFRRAS